MFTVKVTVAILTLATSFVFAAPATSAEAPVVPATSTTLQIASVNGTAGSLAE